MNTNEQIRRALELCVREMCNFCKEAARAKSELDPLAPIVCVEGCETLRIAKEALALPLRNCDVGTAEEQSARFVAWRYSNPLRAELGWDALEWAQKPYEQEGDEEHGKA